MTMETVTAQTESQPIACDLGERELAIRSEELRQNLFVAVEDTQELADGYAFRFPNEDAYLSKLIEFVNAERRCCSFFRIELAFEPNHGPIWLSLRGPAGVKEFVAGLVDLVQR